MRSSFVVMPAFVIAATVACAGLAACSAPTIPAPDLQTEEDPITDPKTDAGKKKDSSTPTNPTRPPPPGDDRDAAAPTATACGAETTQKACFVCCEAANPKALPFLGNAWGACACATPGACKADCAATFCGGKAPAQGDACDLCLTRIDAACVTQSETACDANADCKGLFACDVAAKCEAKAP